MATGMNTRQVAVSTSTTQISGFPAAGTKYLAFQNQDASNDVYIKLGPGPATTDNGVKIKSGEFYEVTPGFYHEEEIHGISTVAPVNVLVVFG